MGQTKEGIKKCERKQYNKKSRNRKLIEERRDKA
jgi:hypothetical protein